MAFSTSASISLFLVAMVCCLYSVTATGVPTPSADAERQSRQMYVATPQFYNYYNPYVMMPMVYPYQASAFPIYPAAVTEGESVVEPTERGSSDTVNILPAATECLSTNAATEGMVPCLKTSGAAHGSLTIKLPAKDQVAVFGIVRSSNSRITLRCSQMTAVAAFTKTGQINAPSDTPRTETGALQLVVTSTDANGLMKCTW